MFDALQNPVTIDKSTKKSTRLNCITNKLPCCPSPLIEVEHYWRPRFDSAVCYLPPFKPWLIAMRSTQPKRLFHPLKQGFIWYFDTLFSACVCVSWIAHHAFHRREIFNFLSQSDATENGAIHFILFEFIERKVHDQLTENEYGSLGGS